MRRKRYQVGCAQRRDCVRTQGGDLGKPRRELQEKPALLRPWSCTSVLQNCEEEMSVVFAMAAWADSNASPSPSPWWTAAVIAKGWDGTNPRCSSDFRFLFFWALRSQQDLWASRPHLKVQDLRASYRKSAFLKGWQHFYCERWEGKEKIKP